MAEEGLPSPAVHAFAIRARTIGSNLEIRNALDQVVAHCLDSCVVALPAGSYTLRQTYSNGRAPREEEFDVQHEGGLELEDANDAMAVIGVLSTVTGGIALMASGAFLL